MTNIPPEVFDLKQVAVTQLPEEIRRHYSKLFYFGYAWLNEEQAVVQSYPDGDKGDMETDSWVRTPHGWVKQ